MKCTVKFKLNQVSCPGTLHLHDRHPVYLVICLFGKVQRTQHIYPSFPMVFQSKVKFERIFTNAKIPDHVLEILDDESILIELRQHIKSHKGNGVALASYVECARTFLFPYASNVPKNDHSQREVLLARTEHFSAGRGLDPQLVFHTKTSIEEDPSVIVTTHGVTVSKQLPSSALLHRPKTTIKVKRDRRRTAINKSLPSVLSLQTTSSDDDDCEKDEIESGQDGAANTKSNRKVERHCICECPSLKDGVFDLREWIRSLVTNKRVLGKKDIRPFRTGKAPEELIAKRKFEGDSPNKVMMLQRKICRSCLVPSKLCVLCNAYKTVYGPEAFLKYRFERYRQDNSVKSNSITDEHFFAENNSFADKHSFADLNTKVDSTLKSKEDANTFAYHERKGNSSSIFQNTPSSNRKKKVILATPSPRSSRKLVAPTSDSFLSRSCYQRPYSDSDSEEVDNLSDSYKKKFTHSVIVDDYLKSKISFASPKDNSKGNFQDRSEYNSFDNVLKPDLTSSTPNRASLFSTDYAANINGHKSFLEESNQIHERIKTLMKKNKSVLQYELSSSSSSSSSEVSCLENAGEKSSVDASKLYREGNFKRSAKHKPLESRVKPLPGGELWSSNRCYRLDNQTSRDVFDSSLKSIYEDLYERTLRRK